MINLERLAFSRNPEHKIKRVDIKIPSEVKYIRKVSSRMLKDLARLRIDKSKMFDIRLCTEEAVRNAMVHGNKSDKKLPVKVGYWVEDSKFSIEIEDQGKGFDYKGVPDPTVDGNIMRTSGRGVHLILNLMNEVHYNEAGNRVLMVKYLK